MNSGAHDWLLLRGGGQFRDGSGISIEKERAIFNSVTTFLNENGLVRVPLSFPEGGDWEGFEIRQSHLTDQGWLVMSKALSKWLAGIDRGRDPSNITQLEKALVSSPTR